MTAPATAPRCAQVSALVTPDEYNALVALAEREAMSVSTLVRRLIRSAVALQLPAR
jgi:hypothetical protein